MLTVHTELPCHGLQEEPGGVQVHGDHQGWVPSEKKTPLKMTFRSGLTSSPNLFDAHRASYSSFLTQKACDNFLGHPEDSLSNS